MIIILILLGIYILVNIFAACKFIDNHDLDEVEICEITMLDLLIGQLCLVILFCAKYSVIFYDKIKLKQRLTNFFDYRPFK